MFRPVLSDWRRCWHRTPMKLLAIAGAIQGAVVTCPAAISDHLPSWVMQTASSVAFVAMVVAGLGIGKDTRPERENVKPPVTPN